MVAYCSGYCIGSDQRS